MHSAYWNAPHLHHPDGQILPPVHQVCKHHTRNRECVVSIQIALLCISTPQLRAFMLPSVMPCPYTGKSQHGTVRDCAHAGPHQSTSQCWFCCSWAAPSGTPKWHWALPLAHGFCAAPSCWRASPRKMRVTGRAARALTVSTASLSSFCCAELSAIQL